MVSGLSAGEAELFADMLTSHLVRAGAYRVIDRSERDAILREIEFSVSDCSDESCQLQAGRMLAASRIVVGGIGFMGNLFLVSLRLLNVETGEAEAGLSEKYPSLEALAGDGERLAAALAGGSPGAPAASYRPLTAQSLISSAKAQELSARLARLRSRVRPAEYEDWLKRKGFAGYERDAAVEEKLVFLEEYLDQRNTRGHSLDLGLALFLPHEYTETTTGSDTTHELKGGFGATLGWAYQFSSRFSAGAWASASLGPATITNIVGPSDIVAFALGTGPAVVIGDKTDAAALLLAAGFGWVYGGGGLAVPLRAGFYFKNFHAAYTGWLAAVEASYHHQLDAGYSIFLGRRKSWPPRP